MFNNELREKNKKQFLNVLIKFHLNLKKEKKKKDCRNHDRMVAGFTTTYTISANHH